MSIYEDGTYLKNNPSWHMEDSAFKAKHIDQIIKKNCLQVESIAEIGCGAGGVLSRLAECMQDSTLQFYGYDISRDAIELAKTLERENVHFELCNLFEQEKRFDILLIIDVFEHIPDYLSFVSQCRCKAKYKIFHIPLDIHVSSVLRGTLSNARAQVGHLHYFTYESALDTIRDTGHQIVDVAFTPTAIALFRQHPSLKRAIANIPRWFVSLISTKLAARWFGGYSLLVLTK